MKTNLSRTDLPKPNFIIRWFYGRWIKVLQKADEDYNKLRATQGLPPLNNIGRWVWLVDNPNAPENQL